MGSFRAVAVAATSVVLAVTMASCSTQTTDEACRHAEDELESSSLLEQEHFGQADLAAEYRKIAKGVKNKQVKSALAEAAVVMERHADILDQLVDDPDSLDDADLEKLETAEKELEEVGERIDNLCRSH